MAESNKMIFIVLFICSLLCLVCRSQQLPYDYFQPCWFNVSGELNVSYTPEELDFVELYLDVNVVQPLMSANETDDVVSLVQELTQNASITLFFEEPSVYTLGDVLHMFDTVFVTIEAQNVSLPDKDLYTYLVAGYNLVMHTCTDEEDLPNYEFLVRSMVKEMTRKYLVEEIVADKEEEGINAAAIGLVFIWGVLSPTPMDIQEAITVVVGGITDAIQSTEDTNSVAIIDIDAAQQLIIVDIVQLLMDPDSLTDTFGDTDLGLFTGSNAIRELIDD